MAADGPKGLPRFELDDESDFPADLSDLATKVEDRIDRYRDTYAELAAISPKWPGMRVWANDRQAEYVWTGATYKRTSPYTVLFAGGTNVNGIALFSHNNGTPPTGYGEPVLGPGTPEALLKILTGVIWDNNGSNTVQVRFRREDSNEWIGGQPVVAWLPVFP